MRTVNAEMSWNPSARVGKALMRVHQREIDLVRSGLEEKMRTTYSQMSHLWNQAEGIDDLRSAAYVIALTRIKGIYEAIGI